MQSHHSKNLLAVQRPSGDGSMTSLSETFQGLLSHLMKNATYSGMDPLLLVKHACLFEGENSIHPQCSLMLLDKVKAREAERQQL